MLTTTHAIPKSSHPFKKKFIFSSSKNLPHSLACILGIVPGAIALTKLHRTNCKRPLTLCKSESTLVRVRRAQYKCALILRKRAANGSHMRHTPSCNSVIVSVDLKGFPNISAIHWCSSLSLSPMNISFNSSLSSDIYFTEARKQQPQ